MVEIIYDIHNVHRMWDGDMAEHEWIMTSKGLKCTDCIFHGDEKEEDDDEEEDDDKDEWEENWWDEDSTGETI